MGGGGGYDIGLSASMASSSTSGVDTGAITFGDNIAGGTKLPKWVLPIAVVFAFLLAITWVLRK